MKNPALNLEINRDQAFVLNVTPMQIEDALYSAYGTRQISTILAPTNDYQVIMELLQAVSDRPDGALHAVHPLLDRAARAAGFGHDAARERRPAGDQPFRPASVA